MMHEVDESEFSAGTSGGAEKTFYGLVGWNAVHLLIGLVAGCVALGTTHWIGKEHRRAREPRTLSSQHRLAIPSTSSPPPFRS